MAKYEEEKKSEAEMKKSYQATLIPEEQGEETENENVSPDLIKGNPEKKIELDISVACSGRT